MIQPTFLNEGQQTMLKSGRLRALRMAIFVLRESGIKTLPVFLALLTIMHPNLPYNILSHYPFAWLMNFLSSNATHSFVEPFLQLMTFTFNLLFYYSATRHCFLVMIKLVICTWSFSAFLNHWYFTFPLPTFLKAYRETQILAGMFNEFCGPLLVTLLVSLVAGQVTAAVQIVTILEVVNRNETSDHDRNIASYLAVMFALLLLNSMIILNFIFGYCAYVLEASKRCVEKAVQDTARGSYGCKKEFKLRVAALVDIKVKFGRTSNFVDKLTPVVYQQFIVETFTDILLIS